MPRRASLLGVVLTAAAAATAAAWGGTGSARAADLTPAQQCVRDGVPIPTVTLPPEVAPAKPLKARVIGGWAFLDPDMLLHGARVRVLDARGRALPLLRGSTTRTGAGGTFLVGVRTLTKRFTVTISGGDVRGEPFQGTLAQTVWGGNRTLYISPASTVAAKYLRAHTGATVADGVTRAKHTLQIPEDATLRGDLRYSDLYFDAQSFLARAGTEGGVDKLLALLGRAGTPVGFPGNPNPTPTPTVDLGQWMQDKIADGAASYVGALAMGWVLGQMGIQSGADAQLAEISAKLDEINHKLTLISQQLNELLKQANEQYLATLALSLGAARSQIDSRMDDVAWVAQAALQPHDPKYLELETCRKLAALYPLASGTLDYGYASKLIQGAFFPDSTGVKPLAEAEALVVRDKSRFWTQTSRDTASSLAGFWSLQDANFLQLKLEWEHSVSPCPSTPPPTPANCESMRWPAMIIALTAAQQDTVPISPAGTWLDRNTNLMWGPTTAPPATLFRHPVPANAFYTFYPFFDWIGDQVPANACVNLPGASGQVADPRDISLCAVDLAPPGAAGPLDPYRDWTPPTLNDYDALVGDYSSKGFANPYDYLTADPRAGGMGVDPGWLDDGTKQIWVYPCLSSYPYLFCAWEKLLGGNAGSFLIDTSVHGADYQAGPSLGFLFKRGESKPDRFWSARLTGGPVRYVNSTGVDAGNDCNSFRAPCKTIARAVDQANAGDVIRLGGTGPLPGGVTISKSVTIAGASAGLTTIAGGNPVVRIASGATVRIQRVTITGGNVTAADLGGGIDNMGALTLVDSAVTGNHAPDGGGIHNGNGGTLKIIRSTISGNTGVRMGGVENRAPDFTATPASLLVVDSTISGNTGGGLLTAVGNPAFLYNVTVTGNTPSSGNTFGAVGGAPVTATNTVIAANPGLADCYGQIVAGLRGHNLIGNTGADCTFVAGPSSGNKIGTAASPIDAKLGALGPNGGPTQTVKPQDGSPAIGAGDPSACSEPATVVGLDQRGYVRPAGSCDIGALDTRATTQVP